MKQRLSGTLVFMWKPRQTEGRGVDSGYSVVQNGTLQEAMHKLKITENGIAVARFGSRYSVHVPTKQAEPHSRPDQPGDPFPFSNFEVSKTYEIRPLLHGTQKFGVLSMLKALGLEGASVTTLQSGLTEHGLAGRSGGGASQNDHGHRCRGHDDLAAPFSCRR